MPQFNLSNQDLMALTAYLLTLREREAPSGPLEGPLSAAALAGKETFGTFCNACHPGGAAGIGPKLFGTDFAKRYAQDEPLIQIIRNGKGSMPGFSTAQISDSQLAELVAYLRSLKDAGQ
jgi:mono/diheme cytochrome c family protein